MVNVFLNHFSIRYDPVKQCILIYPRILQHGRALIELKLDMLKEMGFAGASRWLGESILLLVPETRATFLPETKDDQSPISFVTNLINSIDAKNDEAADHAYEMSMLFLLRYRLNNDEGDSFLRADELIREAAAKGHKHARESLARDWDGAAKKGR